MHLCYLRRNFLQARGPEVKKFSMWLGISFGILLVVAFTVLSFMAGSPKDAVYMVRYALPYMHRGNLKVGDTAPDARLLALDGLQHFHIRERTGARPLIIIFGSYT